MQQLILNADTLIACDAQGLTLHSILADGSAPQALRRVAQPSALNIFFPDPAGERMSGVCAGRLARPPWRPRPRRAAQAHQPRPPLRLPLRVCVVARWRVGRVLICVVGPTRRRRL